MTILTATGWRSASNCSRRPPDAGFISLEPRQQRLGLDHPRVCGVKLGWHRAQGDGQQVAAGRCYRLVTPATSPLALAGLHASHSLLADGNGEPGIERGATRGAPPPVGSALGQFKTLGPPVGPPLFARGDQKRLVGFRLHNGQARMTCKTTAYGASECFSQTQCH